MEQPILDRASQAAETPLTAVLGRAGGKQVSRSQWIGRMRERRHPNVVAVALANKNARIVWSILARGEEYRPAVVATAA